MWRKIVAGLALFAVLTSAADAGSGRVRAPQKLMLLGNAPSASGPAAQPVRPVATRAIVGQAFTSSVPAGDVQGQSRSLFYFAGAPVADVSVCYGNWAGPGEIPGAGNITIDVGLELPFPAATKPFTWGGNASVTLTPGQLACSDFIPASAFSTTLYPFSAFLANSPAWYRTNIVASGTVSTFPESFGPNPLACTPVTAPTIEPCTAAEQAIAAPVFTSQSTGTGALTIPAGGSNVPAMTTPFVIIGHFAPGNNMPGLCGLGDSLMAGINDNTQGIVGKGFFNRVSFGADGNQLWPTINLGIGGEGAGGGYATRSAFYKYCTLMDMSQGSNDLVGGATPATAIGNILAKSAAVSAAGVPVVLQNYVIARASAAAPVGWLNTASQTSVIEPNQDTLNGLITSSVGTSGLSGLVDFTSAMGAGGIDLSKWLSDGTTYTTNVTVALGTPTQFSFSTGTFTSADIGKQIYVPGAGAAGAALQTTITAVASTTAITTSPGASTALTGTSEQVVYGTSGYCTGDGIHPSILCSVRMATTLNTSVTTLGLQLPARTCTGQKAGSDWDFDFKGGCYYGTNPQQFFDFPGTGTGAGISRTTAEYGPTTTTSAAQLPLFGANKARIIPTRGMMIEKTTINLFAAPFAPATQTVTVTNATQYTASIVGPGSMVLSGGCTGTVSAGSPVTCTTSTTSLTGTISGAPLAMQVELGAVATAPTTGTRPAEQVGFQSQVLSQAGTGTQGSTVVTVEGNPTSGTVWGAFGAQYMQRASASTISTNQTTLTATTGTGANGHIVLGQGWNASGRELCGNGQASASDANTSFGIVGQLYLAGVGTGGGGSNLGGGSAVIQRITHYPDRFGSSSVVSCQTATTP